MGLYHKLQECFGAFDSHRHAQQIAHFYDFNAVRLNQEDWWLVRRTCRGLFLWTHYRYGLYVDTLLVVSLLWMLSVIVWLLVPFGKFLYGFVYESCITAISSRIEFARVAITFVVLLATNIATFCILIVLIIIVTLLVLAIVPSINGLILTRILQMTVTGGEVPLDFGGVHLTPWIRNRKFTLMVRVNEFGLGNPPDRGFPHWYFLHVMKATFVISISFDSIVNLPRLIQTHWSPFPTVCKENTRKHGPVEKVGLLQFEFIEFSGVNLFFEMGTNGDLNVNAFVRMLAEQEAYSVFKAKDQPKPVPCTSVPSVPVYQCTSVPLHA